MFAAVLPVTTVLAQPAYPSKPIRLLVPFGPGGVGDITSRAVMQKMSEAMGQQIIIDNRPSAGGIVATETVAKSEPDGYTLMLLNNTNAVSAAMFKKLPYDTLKDFAMISTIGAFSLGVLVSPDSPVKSVKELIAQAKSNPGKFNVGTINIGTTQYLAGELLKSMASIDATTVPFNNTAGVLTALRGGSVQVALEFLPPVLGQIRANGLRAIAVTSRTRFTLLPDVPTLNESGLAGYEVNSWNGIAAAVRTPHAIVERLNKELHAAVNSAQIKQRFQELGVQPNLSSPDGMRKLLVDEIAKWNALIDKAKIPRL
jgi:tripartite-type tricarboxylate transporter receptor subunit TctC